MWVFLNDAFLSIVQPTPADMVFADVSGDLLSVRARAKADLTRTFPGCKVIAWTGRDYPFRTFLPRAQVAEVMAARVIATTATNFKNSVKEKARHDAYLGVWSTMMRWGRGAAQAVSGGKGQGARTDRRLLDWNSRC